MIETENREILRYLGYSNRTAPDPRVLSDIEKCKAELLEAVSPKCVTRIFDPVFDESRSIVEIGGMRVESRGFYRHMQGCRQAVLFAATLGIGADRLISRSQVYSMSKAVVFQAAAAAMIEAYCDSICAKISQEAALRGLYAKTRFSPGYGDFPIQHQRAFCELLNTSQSIGLTLTDSCMMIPSKSVTAVVGLCESCTPETAAAKCKTCTLTHCVYKE